MNDLQTNLRNRIRMITHLRDEVMGPWTDFKNHGVRLVPRVGGGWMFPPDLVSPRQLCFIEDPDGTCREVLNSYEPPSQRYGVGILYPQENEGGSPPTLDQDTPSDITIEDRFGTEANGAKFQKSLGVRREKLDRVRDDEVPEPDIVASELLSETNTFKPSAMGISFRAHTNSETKFRIRVRGGRYARIEVGEFVPEMQVKTPSEDATESEAQRSPGTDSSAAAVERKQGASSAESAASTPKSEEAESTKDARHLTHWVHIPVELEFLVPAEHLTAGDSIHCQAFHVGEKPYVGNLNLDVIIFLRQSMGDPQSGERVFTVCLVNRTRSETGGLEQMAFFQAQFEVELEQGVILPYPEPPPTALSEEEASNALIYRTRPIFGTGHGCSADWGAPVKDNPFIRRCAEGVESLSTVVATPFPCFELPNVSPDVTLLDGTRLAASMKKLAGLIEGDDGMEEVRRIIEGYHQWIADRRTEIPTLPKHHQPTAQRHLNTCEECYQRILRGSELLENDPVAARAFKLANEAIYIQQKRAGRTRKWRFDATEQRMLLDSPAEAFCRPDSDVGRWRPFQIAFILMNLTSAIDPEDHDRATVDLIWFPTGGGKTEAYLGLAAYAMLYRRLKNPSDSGTHVIMRYTLRLLTAQQFQRASGLVCALEHIRRRENRRVGTDELGSDPFSIGLWVGGANTPNKNEEARTAFQEMARPDGRYPFVLQRCPWCGAEVGRVQTENHGPGQRRARRGGGRQQQRAYQAQGLQQRGNEVVFACGDPTCEFRDQIPVLVVDEQIYDRPPTILIGTIDKFAAIAWNPSVRAIFGIDQDGVRRRSPPELIIQDELHLITGPLGTVSAMYETVIGELCVDRRNEQARVPKIISSTATTSNFTEQIRALYARPRAVLFPPPGLDSSDNYFSTYETERDESGETVPSPGRIHVGLHAPGYPSMQTTDVHTVASLLNAPSYMAQEERDPWWTLLWFFNSIRELGSGLTLLLGDIPERLAVLRKRLNRAQKSGGKVTYDNTRWLNETGIMELTSRIENSEVPAAIEQLQTPYTEEKNRSYDCCLASSIIEVGVDITRLAMMTILGQPKTTAQYIQVAGRVGRDRSRPGLVVTIYNPARPRDRSHFERFRSYHDRLYSNVEPASLTPFTTPAVQKTISGLLAGYLRQTQVVAKTGESLYEARIFAGEARDIIFARCEEVTGTPASPELESLIEGYITIMRMTPLNVWSRTDQMSVDPALLRRAGAPCHPNWKRTDCWPTLTSMRTVDAECRAGVLLPPPIIL